MALWNIVRKSVFKRSQEIHGGENYFTTIYSGDETIFCLRVVFAEWTENFILRTSPSSFIRGLMFQVEKKLEQCQPNVAALEGISNRLKRCQISLLKADESEIERDNFYLKFFDCFKHELNLASSQGVNANLLASLPVSPKISDYPDQVGNVDWYSLNQTGTSSFMNEVDTSEITARVDTLLIALDQSLNSFPGDIRRLEHAISVTESYSIFFVNPSHWSQVLGAEGQFNARPRPEDQDTVRKASLTCFWTRGIHEVYTRKTALENKLRDLLKSCSDLIDEIEKLQQLIERKQQLSAIGVAKFDIKLEFEKHIQRNSEKLLDLIQRIDQWIFSTKNSYNEDQIRARIIQMTHYSYEHHSHLIRDPNTFQFNLDGFHTDLINIKFRLLQKTALCIQTQPHQVKKTESANFVSLRFHNFEKIFEKEPTKGLQVYLILADTAMQIKSTNRLPDKLSEIAAGRVVTPDFSISTTIEDSSGRRRRRRQASSYENITYSADRKHVNVNLDFQIKEVDRKNVDLKYVYKIKYVLLFVKDFVVDGETIRTWKMSLPMVIITHTSQEKDGWSIISWFNAFPFMKRDHYEDRPVKNRHMVLEMLVGVFSELVGVHLKRSHIEYIKKKLNDSIPGDITWRRLYEDKMLDDEYSYWTWFFLSTKVLGGYFKESFEKGHIEAFISWEDAANLLLKSQVSSGTFIPRLSDSEPGSLSLIFLDREGNPQRMIPYKFFDHGQGMKQISKAFLELLDAKYTAGGEAFRWLYPNIDKRAAFSKFYDYIPQFSPPEKRKHYVPLERSIAAVPLKSSSPPPKIEVDPRKNSASSHSGYSLMEDEDDPYIAQMFTIDQDYAMVEPEGGLHGLVRDLLNYESILHRPLADA